MKDLYEVLRQKEMEMGRLRKEVEALRKIIPLLAESNSAGAPESASPGAVHNKWPLELNGQRSASAGL